MKATSEGVYSILVIDHEKNRDPNLLSKTPVPLTWMSRAEGAQIALSDPKRGFSAIFINPLLPRLNGVGMFSQARQARPATPIFCLYSVDAEPSLAPSELDRLSLSGTLAMPLASKALASLATAQLGAENFARSSASDFGQGDPEYLAVPARDFISGLPTPFDVHLKLPSGRYHQVVNAREVFEPARALSYISKGATHFHLTRRSLNACLNYGRLLDRVLLQSDQVGFEFKINQLFTQTQNALELFQKNGMQAGALDQAHGVLDHLHSLFGTVAADDPRLLKALLDNHEAYDHSVAVTWTCALLMRPLEIKTRSGFNSLGLAALLHDIGLMDLPRSVHHEDESQMNEDELRVYRTHSVKGAELVSKIPEIETAAVQAVAHHHERRSHADLGRMTEIVGLSDEFVRRLGRGLSLRELMAEMESGVFAGFSYPVASAFRSLFKSLKV